MKTRLQKIIAGAGLASRREAERWISDGKVMVNGRTITQLGASADPEVDSIKVRGKVIPPQTDKMYLAFFKPTNCLTTLKDDGQRPTVMDYFKKIQTKIYPVGRLDFNTQGILLLTNDGQLSKDLLTPGNRIPRTYRAKVRGVPEQKTLNRLKSGLNLDSDPTMPLDADIWRISGRNCFLNLTLYEGKNRHIKRVCEIVRHPVIKLKRTHFAFINLNGLEPGDYRHLTRKEIENLQRLVAKARKNNSSISPV
jgi:pseudouridine synthase